MDAFFDYVPTVRYVGLVLLVTTWLVVSFTSPSPRRTVFEWLAAVGLYVTLLSVFLHGLDLAMDFESVAARRAAMAGLGFLICMFSLGFVLSVVQVFASLRGPAKAVSSATN